MKMKKMKMTKRAAASLAALVLGAAGLSWAHGAGQHVMGTVKNVQADKLEVVTPKGKEVAIALAPSTKYYHGLKKAAPAASSDVKVGIRVIVDVVKKGEVFEATEVRIGKAPEAQ